MTRRTRRTPTPPPVIDRPVSDETLAEAKRLAGGDTRRIRANRDGTVTILNTPRPVTASLRGWRPGM